MILSIQRRYIEGKVGKGPKKHHTKLLQTAVSAALIPQKEAIKSTET